MEIKSVKEEKIEYPKINEISNKKLKTCIPNKCMKLGVTSFLFDVLMRSKAFAISQYEVLPGEMVVAGGEISYYNPIYMYVSAGCNIASIISVLMFLISVIRIIYIKLKAKKQDNKTKVSKIGKIICIISIIVFILSRIGVMIANYLE